MNKLQRIKSKKNKIIGIWGFPEPSVLREIKTKFSEYAEYEILDLDINYKSPHSGILPDAYCRIIKNIVDNAVYLKDNLEVVIASIGEEKCDCARFAAKILKDLGFNIVETKYNITENRFSTPISKSGLPLEKKIISIMDNIIEKKEFNLLEVKPEFGFWGVPPNDLSILELFPDSTHVFGWTRCVEAGRPADIELEMFVQEGVPTVFFAQAFCAKMQLAKYLARKHKGLYVDADDRASNSVRAKIEAFIRLG